MAIKTDTKKTSASTLQAAAGTVTPPSLNEPFSWKTPAARAFLSGIQGNILKGHGRHHTMNVFFQITDPVAARPALKLIATAYVTSAIKQLSETERFKAARDAGEEFESETFVIVHLSHSGYQQLGVTAANIPADPRFRAGMQASTDLNDPAVGTWDADLQNGVSGLRIDGMILVAGETVDKVDEMVKVLTGLGEDAFVVTKLQRGTAIFNERGEGLEHFGYVDGRSQPLFLLEDIEGENTAAGSSQWDPAFPPSRVLLAEPGGPGFGSYFIFRKLEEDVRGFKTKEQELADELTFDGEDRERAGALAVGRFEDGTPVVLSKDAITPARGHVPNDFNYDQDPKGGQCPFHAHIRKTNPRGSSFLGEATERLTIMARRGITYEDVARKLGPVGIPESESLAEFNEKVAPLLPEGGVGLLFMAYNVDLDQQFETTQKRWANSADFPVTGIGTDPVIGQPATGSPAQNWPQEWKRSSASPAKPFDFHGFVKLKGGEYFFAPSLPFLRSL